ncbi:uncharacterized protein L3040_003868 [Drepanopeziza brunnea f. sp. 'multigermtubi']|uniref:uncharacterized protein n=1 Tax=Drepanopeziza brunnea f. sp. 'multigermtubi' TaxID=698441 RepID=UPI002396AD21|nr:hypothetical protein L3040_003868 [Drepanopeziza brunnea f. sp. 'multigermtubi']
MSDSSSSILASLGTLPPTYTSFSRANITQLSVPTRSRAAQDGDLCLDSTEGQEAGHWELDYRSANPQARAGTLTSSWWSCLASTPGLEQE